MKTRNHLAVFKIIFVVALLTITIADWRRSQTMFVNESENKQTIEVKSEASEKVPYECLGLLQQFLINGLP